MALWLERIADHVCSYPVVILCLFTGIFFTIHKLFFIQVRSFKNALTLIQGHYDNPNEHGQISHFQALSTALSGTIGLGNIAGVSIAIELGGPGTIFWMWIVGFFGMATKFVECTLGTHYRDENKETGEVRGGPMYYIHKGMGQRWRWLAIFFASCVVLGSFGGGGMFQSNQAAALDKYYSINTHASGAVLALLVGIVILGGITRIGKVASKIVPAMCLIYVMGAIFICISHYDKLPFVFQLIIDDAFTGSAVICGGMTIVLLWGVRRAVLSKEAGLGTASIAHAAVKTDHPVREGIVASLGPLIDTIIVCTATAAIIIMGGAYGTGVYQPVTSIDTHSIELGANWQLQSNAPEDNDPLKTFRSSTDVIETLPVHSSEAVRIPLSMKPQGSIRFSYFKESGNLDIAIHNNSGSHSLTVGDHDPAQPSGDVFSIGCSRESQWEACVLTGSLFDNGYDGILEILPQEGSKWYFDQFEIVEKLEGISLTIASFNKFFEGFGTIFISFSVFLFAFSTMLSWSYYGETALMYIVSRAHHDTMTITPLSQHAATIYKILFLIFIYIGAIKSLEMVISFTDIMVGLMVIPNSIAILSLAGQVKKMSDDYFIKLKAGAFTRYK